MDFDVLSMRKRTKEIMKSANPNVLMLSVIPTLVLFLEIVYGIRIINLSPEKFIVSYIIGIIIMEVCKIGYIGCTMNIVYEKESKWTELFEGFYKNTIKNLIIVLLKQVILIVGFVLLYIPGIILFYKLRFLYYELVSENKPIVQAFKDSMELMKGHSIELFKIDAVFVGWYILNIVTLGLASVYVRPLTTITYVEYYDYLKAKKKIFND